MTCHTWKSDTREGVVAEEVGNASESSDGGVLSAMLKSFDFMDNRYHLKSERRG